MKTPPKSLPRILLSALLLALTQADLHAALEYNVIDIGALTGGGSSFAYGINSSGQVVGRAQSHAFLYSNGSVTNLDTLGSAFSVAYGINDSGQVVGDRFTGLDTHAFTYLNGAMTDLGTLGGPESHARAINSLGHITGNSVTTGGGDHAFLYSSGIMTDLNTLGGSHSFGWGLNTADQVVGQSYTTGYPTAPAFVYSSGSMLQLPNPLFGDQATAIGINESGEIVGYALNTANGQHRGFLYSGGIVTALGTLGGSTSDAYGINASGDIVGSSQIAIGSSLQHGFLYADGTMYDLNDLIPDGTGISDIVVPFTSSHPINDLGQIAAIGTVGGERHALLLTPTAVPEPSTAVFGVIGVAVFFRRRTRK